jgi:hypothetical protein
MGVVTFLTNKDENKLQQQIGITPNCHAEYFAITDDGELSLKPEYRGALTESGDFPYSISNNGMGMAGSLNPKLPSDLIIPEVVNEIAVDRLAIGMFQQNEAIESLTFPDSVYEIPERFCNLAVNLKHINNTEHIKIVNDRAFRDCRIEKIVMPNLEEIKGTLTFYNNSHLTFADVGKVTEIPTKAFKHCMELSKITASGGNLTTIGLEALYSTVNLKNADFLNNLTSIGDKAFGVSKIEHNWNGLDNCSFGTNATHLQYNPTDFWSDTTFTPCENPIPTQFCQRDGRWAGVGFYYNTDGKYKYDFGGSGCTIIAGIHAICGIHNIKLNSPVDFGVLVNNTGIWDNYFPNTDHLPSVLDGIAQTAPEYKVTYAYYTQWTKETVQAMYDTLANGGYAIVEIGAPANHAVAVYGVNAKGELLVLDSEKRYYYDSSKPVKYTIPFRKLISNNSSFIFVTR